MSNRLRLTTIFCAVLGVSGMLAACDDHDDAVPNGDDNGGAAGDAPVAGKSTGGSSPGSAGKAAGGTAGMMTSGGTGGAGTAGAGGEGGAGVEPEVGGAAGAGGGGPDVEYLCGASTISEKLCSALVSVTCDEPTFCADCVPTRETDLELFAECPACLQHMEAFYQCGIDAYESGNTAAGIECFPPADIADACAGSLNEALACNDAKNDPNGPGCPATWPVQ
jgi:hypothetical protein